jgi:hypothetical protein
MEVTRGLSSATQSHSQALKDVQNRAGEVLGTLEAAAEAAGQIRGSLYNPSGWSSWVPYLICPGLSLVMGSYGLAPDAGRNLKLIVLGT